jgi:hypothetical protein
LQEVSQTELQVFELSFGAGALSGVYDKLEDGWPLEACKAALENGNISTCGCGGTMESFWLIFGFSHRDQFV